jgi:hypothetical protein
MWRWVEQIRQHKRSCLGTAYLNMFPVENMCWKLSSSVCLGDGAIKWYEVLTAKLKELPCIERTSRLGALKRSSDHMFYSSSLAMRCTCFKRNIYRQPGLLCTPQDFAWKFKIFRKIKIFFGTKVTSEAFLSISPNLKVTGLQGGTQTKL